MRRYLKVFIFIFIFTRLAFAEYRVYQYTVKNKIRSSVDQPNSNLILSTLNPVSYLAYNGGSSLINIDLLRTWICPGHTGNRKDFCKSPYDKIIERAIQ